jgi:hypothetical protein
VVKIVAIAAAKDAKVGEARDAIAKTANRPFLLRSCGGLRPQPKKEEPEPAPEETVEVSDAVEASDTTEDV